MDGFYLPAAVARIGVQGDKTARRTRRFGNAVRLGIRLSAASATARIRRLGIAAKYHGFRFGAVTAERT